VDLDSTTHYANLKKKFRDNSCPYSEQASTQGQPTRGSTPVFGLSGRLTTPYSKKAALRNVMESLELALQKSVRFLKVLLAFLA
jgi:hypothetical protein